MKQKIRIGISTCPNDTFAFHGLLSGAIQIPGVELEFSLLDIEQLNEGLLSGEFSIAKASFHLALYLADRYYVLPSGSALGFGVGPLLLAAESGRRPKAFSSDAEKREVTLCPGRYTTASLLYELFYPQTARVEQVVFSEIMPRLSEKTADFGVCIHEGRFTWEQQGLWLVEDLGERWEKSCQLPLPLGGILASQLLSPEIAWAVQAGIRQSIEYGLKHPDQALPTMRSFAQEFDDDVLMQHVALYVNDWTLDLGEIGSQALNELQSRAESVALPGLSPARLKVMQAPK